jgi:hypothetical protein
MKNKASFTKLMWATMTPLAVAVFASLLVIVSPVVFAAQPAPDADCAHEIITRGGPGHVVVHWTVDCVKSGLRCADGLCLTETTVSGPGPGGFWCNCDTSAINPHAACHGHWDRAGLGPNEVLSCQDPCRVAGANCVPQPNSAGGMWCKCTP